MNSLSNNNLYITRKRKKWKFAHFDSYANCFTHSRGGDGEYTYQQLQLYLKQSPTVVELAAGNAQFSLELARRYPEKSFVAVDIKSDRLYTSAKKALEEGVGNIAFMRAHMNDLPAIFPEKSIEEVWLTFPDPHPKKRSAKHRLTAPLFLQKYRNILKASGVLKFKTDNRELFLWSLEQFVAANWQIAELSFDLHESNLPDDYKIKTYYEQKFTAQGIVTNYVALSPQSLPTKS